MSDYMNILFDNGLVVSNKFSNSNSPIGGTIMSMMDRLMIVALSEILPIMAFAMPYVIVVLIDLMM